MKGRQPKESPEEVRRRIDELERELSRPLLDLSEQLKPEVVAPPASPRAERSGGLAALLFGLGLTAVGAWFIANQVIVTSGYSALFGPSSFGILLVPFVVGIGLLAFGNGKERLGIAVAALSVLLMLVDVVAGLNVYLRSATLAQFLGMFACLAIGLGLIARASRR